MLIARIYEVLPLLCPLCGGLMRIISFITDSADIRQILDHIGADAVSLRITPERGPPLWAGVNAPKRAILTSNNDYRYRLAMIQSFQCNDTQALFAGKRVARFANFEAVAMRKLQQIHAATVIEFLRVPPGNQLEALKGDRKGQHSIRINAQWRVCFVWVDGHADRVEIVDYH